MPIEILNEIRNKKYSIVNKLISAVTEELRYVMFIERYVFGNLVTWVVSDVVGSKRASFGFKQVK